MSTISTYVLGIWTVFLTKGTPVVDNNTQNMIRLTTDYRNPRVPQVVMIDSEAGE